jgi:hypothetical protein
MDARVAWHSDNPQPGSDHKFNWFALGMTTAEDEKYFEPRHGITGNDVAVYEKYFDEAFTAIAQAIQDAIRSGSTKLSTKEIDGGDIELTSFGTVKVSGITFRQEENPMRSQLRQRFRTTTSLQLRRFLQLVRITPLSTMIWPPVKPSISRSR